MVCAGRPVPLAGWQEELADPEEADRGSAAQFARWAFSLLTLAACGAACAQDAREIVRQSIQLDQANWLRMANYTWVERSRERHFDSQNRVTSTKQEGWETLILGGEPYRRLIERDDQPLPPNERRKQQEKLDKTAVRLDRETPEQKQRRLAEYERERRRDREFLLEIADAYDFHREPDQTLDGQPVWVIDGVPRPGYQPKKRDAKALLKIRGRIWIEKAGYQWVRIEAETTATISFGLFLARLNPGAKLEFEQARINNEVWLPKREFVSGSGRIGLLKKLKEDQETTWTNYRKFDVESRIVSSGPKGP